MFFLHNGTNVTVFSPLGGAVGSFPWQILKGWPRVYFHALLTYFAYLQPLKSYLTFSFWLGFLYCRPNLRGFLGKWPPKSQNFENTCLEGTSSRQTTFFELLCVRIGSRVWAIRVARKEKTKKNKNNNKRHVILIFHHYVGALPLIHVTDSRSTASHSRISLT